MSKPNSSIDRTPEPDFLDHLGRVFGWSREHAAEALGDWISSLEPKAPRQGEGTDAGNRTVEAA